MIGALLGAAGLSAAAGLGSTVLQWGANKNLQEHQYELNREYRQSNYQDVVQDMKKAGINPGLLQGSSVLNSGSGAGVSGISAPHFDTSIINSLLTTSVLKNKDAQKTFEQEYTNAMQTAQKYQNIVDKATARLSNGGFDTL